MNGYVRCPRCGSEFYKDEPWKKICVDCWLKAKGKSKSAPTSQALNMREELEAVRSQLRYYIARCAKLEREIEQQQSVSGLAGHIRDMIFLCHPDKHGDSPKATATTAWLLEVRKELCQ